MDVYRADYAGTHIDSCAGPLVDIERTRLHSQIRILTIMRMLVIFVASHSDVWNADLQIRRRGRTSV